jgi:hypothetical protein
MTLFVKQFDRAQTNKGALYKGPCLIDCMTSRWRRGSYTKPCKKYSIIDYDSGTPPFLGEIALTGASPTNSRRHAYASRKKS